MHVQIKTDSDKYLVKDVLVFGKSWSIEKMFNDTEIQNLVSNCYPKPVPRLQSSKRSGEEKKSLCLYPKITQGGQREDSDHRELNPSMTKVWYHGNGPSRASLSLAADKC